MRNAIVASCLLLYACTRNEPAHQVESARPTARDGAQAHVDQRAVRPVESAKQGPLALDLRVEQSREGVGLHVLSREGEVVELAELVSARPVHGGQADEQALRLRLDCTQRGCVKLATGGELIAPNWLGLIEGERCDALFRPRQAGEYILTVRSCDGKRSSEVRVHWDGP